MGGVTIAIIAALQVILLAGMQYFAASRVAAREADRKDRERREDWARQDQVALKAADAAALLLKVQKDSIVRTDEVARVAAVNNASIQSQLSEANEQGKKIHALVNSDMTAARTNERNQTVLTLAALRRVQTLSHNLGLPIDSNEEEMISKAEKRIEELTAILADRLAAQHEVDKK